MKTKQQIAPPLRRKVFLGLALSAVLIAIWFSTATTRAYIGKPLELDASPQDTVTNTVFNSERSDELLVLLGFSGGGTRAAALAYGVLQELADTEIIDDTGRRRLLDEIDAISSVSGGSFTNAYFGLFGDKIFDDFKDAMLLRPIESDLINRSLNPRNWHDLSSPYYGISDLAASYYDEYLFKGKTFADIDVSSAPKIFINASDIATGERMVFARHLFNLLCVDYDSYPISRAVAASSGVPGVASPITIKNNAGSCGYTLPDWLRKPMENEANRTMAARMQRNLEYLDTSKRPWLHLVDGGITDNLGLRQYYEFSHIDEVAKAFNKRGGYKVNEILLISVNAAVEHKVIWTTAPKHPSRSKALGAMTRIQMRNYTSDTVHIVEQAYRDWMTSRENNVSPVTFDFVEITFSSVNDDEERAYLNELPTSLQLSEVQVDKIIAAGRRLLRESPEFQRFLQRYKPDSESAE
jgi:NTE family protein